MGYRVSIIGAGSVGLCLAVHFAKAGAEVTLLARKKSIKTLTGKAFTSSGLLADHASTPGQIHISDADAPDDRALDCDMLVVTTKAFDVAKVLIPYADVASVGAVLLMQNGLGSADLARTALGPSVPIYSTAMMIGMVRRSPTDVEVTAHSSPVLCGPLLSDDDAPLRKMLDVAAGGFVPMERDEKIEDTILFKLLFNSCMNPTGALTGLNYGGLLENPHTRDLIVDLAQEALQAFHARGYRPAASGQEYVDTILSKIIFPRSAGHKSSMLQDLDAGRITEVDFLNGAIVKLAADAGLTAPKHEAIVSLIHAQETT